MKKITLGKTGLEVTQLGFGGIPIQRLTEEGAVEIVKKVVDMGITYLDTANGYTTSEERIGKAVAGKREKLVIATKTGAKTAEGVEEHLALSLKHLDTDYIDIYQFHGVSDMESLEKVMDPKGPMGVVKAARDKGQVRHISITSHSMEVAKEAVKTDQFETLMFPFNFITREPEDELIPLCREHNVGFIAMKPMAGGMLDNATIAFKYLLQFPDIIAIPGIEQAWEIEEIVALYEGSQKMTAAEEEQMQQMRDELGTRFCRRCNYCQPCSSDIPISTVMTSASFAKRMPPERFFSGMMESTMEKAAACIECGDCEERCPYGLPIRDMIKDQREWFWAEKKKYDEATAGK